MSQPGAAYKELSPNKTLQETFDLLRTFAAVKSYFASNAPERGR
jgi:hypothetical protein